MIRLATERRRLIAASAGLAVVCGLAGCGASGASGDWRSDKSLPVPVGTVLDLTGPLNVYGTTKSNVTRLAIDDINAHGGVLGRKLKLIELDSKSSNDQNVQYANQLATKDRVAVVMGGITSASREAMRPVLDRAKVLYVYNTVYEGGVCDRDLVVTGQSASQLMKPLVEYTAKNIGKKIYIVAADYNFGRISGQWVKEYAKQFGAEVVGEDYISLDSSNFGATLSRIESKKPDAVFSLLVGANHVPFYRGFAAKNLGSVTKIVSPTFGNGNEQEVLSPAESEGIIHAGGYYEGLATPENQAFLAAYAKKFGANHPEVSDTAMSEWYGWHLWAAAVEKAKSFDRDKVLKVIEDGGVSADSPIGQVSIDGPTHHTIQDVSIVQVKNGHFAPIQTFKAQQPEYEQTVCNLVKDPNTNKAFTP